MRHVPIFIPAVQQKPQQEEPEEVIEWQRDQWGRKYRKIGNMIEYAPTVTIDGIEVYQDELEEFNANRRAAMEKNRQAENERLKAKNAPRKICPLQDPLHFQSQCRTDCAMYTETGCALKHRKAAADTKGKHCPYMRTCQECCALYDQGCTI